MAYGSSALSYGMERRKPGGGALYVEDEIAAQADRLPALYALKKGEERADEGFALDERSLVKTEELATLGRESSEAIAERDAQLREAQIASNESIAKRSEALQVKQREQQKKQDEYGNWIAGAGAVASAVSLASDAWGSGNIITDIMSLWS